MRLIFLLLLPLAACISSRDSTDSDVDVGLAYACGNDSTWGVQLQVDAGPWSTIQVEATAGGLAWSTETTDPCTTLDTGLSCSAPLHARAQPVHVSKVYDCAQVTSDGVAGWDTSACTLYEPPVWRSECS